MQVTKQSFWNVVEARSSRWVADYGFGHVAIESLAGVAARHGENGSTRYDVPRPELAVQDAVRRYQQGSAPDAGRARAA